MATVVGPTNTNKNKNSGMSRAAQAAIMERVATSDMNANELMEAIGGAIGMSGDWNVGIFDNIKASDMIQAYKDGVLPSTSDAMKAINSGEYIGNKNDYMNEVLSDIFGLDYEKETGFVSKGASLESKYAPSMSQEHYDRVTSSSFATDFSVGDAQYTYDPSTGQITRKNDGAIISGIDEINDYAASNKGTSSSNASGSAGTPSATGGAGEPTSDYGYGNSDVEIEPVASIGNYTGGSTGGYVTGSVGSTYVPGTGTTAGGTTTGGSSTGVVNGKTGADALADYLAALKIDSDFSKNLNTSRENIESKYNTLFEDLRTGDYTKEPYYQTILDSYGIKGDAAANDASASGAAANGGNLDSYAAANAQRQQLAFKNAAQSAALNAYNSEVASLLKTLGDLGVNVNDLYKTWASELDSQRSGAVNAYLGQLGADTDKYVSDNALAGDKYASDTNKYLGDVQASIDKYLGDLQASTDKYLADAEVQINADKNAANKELAQLEITYNTTMAELDRKHELLKQEASTASAERIAQIEKEIREIEAEKEAATEKYKTDKALEESKYLADTEANSYLEGLKYNTTTGGKIEVKDPTTEEYNKALEIYTTSGAGAAEQYIATLARGKQDLVRAYLNQYGGGKSGATIPDADLNQFVAVIRYGMNNGGTFEEALERKWAQYIADNPSMNTSENKEKLLAYLEGIFNK
jgi:hypothetical protein